MVFRAFSFFDLLMSLLLLVVVVVRLPPIAIGPGACVCGTTGTTEERVRCATSNDVVGDFIGFVPIISNLQN